MPAWIERMLRQECIRRLFACQLRRTLLKSCRHQASGNRSRNQEGCRENRKVSCGYYALLVGDRNLMVKSSKPISETTSGELVLISADIFNHM